MLGIEYLTTAKQKITIKGLYKYDNDYPVSTLDGISLACKGGDYGQVGDEPVVSTGKGRAYGVEILAQVRNFYGFFGNVSYTLFSSEFSGLDGIYRPSAWDGRHIVNINANYRFLKTWSASVRWRYTGGTPYSPIDDLSYNREAWELSGRPYTDYNQYNSLRLKPSHQLDIRVDKDFYFKHFALNIYIDIQNLYYNANPTVPIYTNLDPNGVIMPDAAGDPTKQQLRQLKSDSQTILPTLGVIFRI